MTEFPDDYILTTKNIVPVPKIQAKTNESVTIDSLEYSKFNAMIYKTKKKNKTVICRWCQRCLVVYKRSMLESDINKPVFH